MDEELDDILKNRIKEVFENFEDSSADEGWLLLREKYPEKQSKRRALGWLWWGSAAAILLVFLGIGLWLNNKDVKPQKSIVKIKHANPTNPAMAEQKHYRDNGLVGLNQKTAASTYASNLSNTNVKSKAEPQINNHRESDEKAMVKEVSDQHNHAQKTQVDSTNFAISKPSSQPLNIPGQPDSATIIAKGKSLKPEQSINTMFAENQAAKPKKDEINTSKKIHFSVYAATYFNYAKGSDNQINAGAGFSSDIKISKKLKLVTGIAIGQNTLNYAAVPQPPIANSAALKGGLQLVSANVREPVLTGYNASLVGLDIPLNLKYEFNPQKNDTYISAGLSSGTFINELYTYHYQDDLQPSSNHDATNHQAFNSFYLAKTLNLAFGVGYPLGKSNRLVIEPFFKYPLDGLGAQQIRFGAGGINLKLNFQSQKK